MQIESQIQASQITMIDFYCVYGKFVIQFIILFANFGFSSLRWQLVAFLYARGVKLYICCLIAITDDDSNERKLKTSKKIEMNCRQQIKKSFKKTKKIGKLVEYHGK